ncbi:MAG: ATP-binding protein [Lentisphaerae bacterium]|jgi:hypothetical protein|nr:ATP-binding protein [Lentisphaerota bacterium]
MKKLTSSVYSLEKLIENDFLYVDKTEYIWKLVDSAPASYFMARPRRFGKSLTVSTLKAVFQGRKELFKGLAIHDKEYDWKEYPVIHLDLANCDAKTPASLRKYLACILAWAAAEHDVEVEIQEDGLASSFEALIKGIGNRMPVVILLDEYDKPILNTILTPEARECLTILKGFYSTIKKCESLEHFVFVTGVTKFSHVSIFSDLNNLTDITMHADYATMFGYTQEEFEKYFSNHIENVARKMGISREELLPEIITWYDGYRFHENADSVYNPVSLALFFVNGGEFNNYWFDTGTPSFLIELIKKNNFSFENILAHPVSKMAFKAFEVTQIDPLSLLLQTGYLTIKSMERRFNMPWYWLDFPNQEVGMSFNTYLLKAYAGTSDAEVTNFCGRIAEALVSGDVESLRKVLEVFFAGFPYDLHQKNENNFQNIFYSLFRLLGYYIEAESRTNNGRIDAVVKTDQWIYLFEFKIDKNADGALSQIKNKDYVRKYMLSGKKVMLIGASFDTSNGKLSDWQTEFL